MREKSNAQVLTIGEFNDSFPPLMDGVGNVVKNYTEELIRLGHSAYVVTSGTKEGTAYDASHGIDYTLRCRMYPVPGLKPYGISLRDAGFNRKLVAIPFDLVHSHGPFFTGRIAQRIARKSRIPLVATFHTQFREDVLGIVKSRKMADEITSILLKHYEGADEVWAPSEWSRRKLHGYGFAKEVLIVENGCDMDVPDTEGFARYRSAGIDLAKTKSNVPILVYVGQHKKEKNLQLTLDALVILRKRGVHFRMVFVGEGPNKKEYEEFVVQNHLSDSVVFLGKITERESIKALYAAGRLFLFPSLYDTSALVMREAAAFNLPLVYVSGSCTSESITDKVNGFIAGDMPQAYADTIQWAVTHPRAVETAGMGARQSLYRHWREAVEEVEERYRMILERHQRSPR